LRIHDYMICSGLSATKVLRTGYFPHINHAQTAIGLGSGNFQNRRHVRCPRPSSKWQWASQGKDRRIISGVESGATVFVVRSDSGIISLNDSANTVFASPRLGNRHT
jgi:NitT/TauT family transport system substrate-binding protein